MSLQIRQISDVPEETKHVAQKAFPKGNAYMMLRDELGVMFGDERWAELFSERGRPVESPGMLALVTVLQFGENLSDRQAADAVRSRIDWKYLLGLELSDPGFDYTLLSDFRMRLLANDKVDDLLNCVLEVFKERGLVKSRGRQRTDSTHILGAVRDLNRLECVGEGLRQALNSLAVEAPEWLQGRVPASWYQRYGSRFETYRLPRERSEQEQLALEIGGDGYQLLQWLVEDKAPMGLKDKRAVQILRLLWLQNYYREEEGVHWRREGNLPPGELLIQSPYDPEVRFSRKRNLEWKGYKGHVSETCDEGLPHLITNVETTPATTPDGSMTETIQAHLADKGLLPAEHLLDAGYVDADLLVKSQAQGIDLVGPAAEDASWQARAGQGFASTCFNVDWENRIVVCPGGKQSQKWTPSKDAAGNAVIHIRFNAHECQACPLRCQCTHSPTAARTLTLRTQPQYEALQQARLRQRTAAFKHVYDKRAGIEATVSQHVRVCDIRHARYLGRAKTHLQLVASAIAINLARCVAWFNHRPLASTRFSSFAALVPA